jgi:hypothetical protein
MRPIPVGVSLMFFLFDLLRLEARTNLAHAIVLRKLGRSFRYALASFLLIVAHLMRLCYPKGRVVAIDLEPGDA